MIFEKAPKESEACRVSLAPLRPLAFWGFAAGLVCFALGVSGDIYIYIYIIIFLGGWGRGKEILSPNLEIFRVALLYNL